MTKMTQLAQAVTKKKMSSDAVHGPVAATTMQASGSRRVLAGLLAALSLAAVPLSVGIAGLVAPSAHAQERTTVRRTIRGRVEGSADTPLKGAVVYLKDTRTLAVKSFLSDDEGMFHFGQLSTNTDYELYAEFNGKRSKSKNISSFDSKTELTFTLRVD